MACERKDKKVRTTARHPSGIKYASRMCQGDELQKLEAVKAWQMALQEKFKFAKAGDAFGSTKIPKKGTPAYKKLKKRQMEILKGKI